MPLLNVSKAAVKHSSNEVIRCNLRLAESGLEFLAVGQCADQDPVRPQPPIRAS